MWQIIGPGAIGCLWAANLLRTDQEIHLVSRNSGLNNTLYYQDLQQQSYQFKISSSTTLLSSKDPILVCVKATQVKQALQMQLAMIAPEQAIILMHNGMGCAEQVQALLPNNPIICATTANASLLLGPLDIQQTGLGYTYLGPFNERAKSLQKLITPLNKALANTEWTDDVSQKLWLKLLINLAINPLTAIHQIKNGELKGNYFENKIAAITAEALQVTSAEKINFNKNELLNIIEQVISATAENYSSMNRDIHFQRETENEYISGYILAKAAQHKIKTPIIQSLYQEIKALESR